MQTRPANPWKIIFDALRWLMLLPAALAAWVGTALSGIFLIEPVKQMCIGLRLDLAWYSGLCGSGDDVGALFIHLCTGVSALAVETAVVLVAPEYRRICLWAAFGLGCAAAYLLAGSAGYMPGRLGAQSYAHAAAACGLIGAWLYDRLLARVPAA